MSNVLDRGNTRQLEDAEVVRTSKGDVPDYLCAESVNRVYLAEAKGRYSSVSFRNQEFDAWRKQFTRVQVRDVHSRPMIVKGYIVATRYGTESNQPRVDSGIFAEDPESFGKRPIDGEVAASIGEAIIAEHYVPILEKLDQSLLAASLASGSTIPDQIQIQGTRWQMHFADFENLRFVGGCWPSSEGTPPFRVENGKLIIQPRDPLRLVRLSHKVLAY